MDHNFCTTCDKAVSPFSNSLYCSEECLHNDAHLRPNDLHTLQEYQDKIGVPRRSGSSVSLNSNSKFTIYSSHSSGTSSPPLSPYYRVSKERMSPPGFSLASDSSRSSLSSYGLEMRMSRPK